MISTILQQKIAQAGGKISFASFMQTALYDPQYGYYSCLNAIGSSGDFTTAPEISPLFARLVARQCEPLFDELQAYNVLEIGAGSGQFAIDFLSELQERSTQINQYFIYEISPVLRQKQQNFLKEKRPEWINRIVWLDKFPGDFSGIVIANEVLDALPVHCFRVENQTIYERYVSFQNDEFAWKIDYPSSQKLFDEGERLIKTFDLPNLYESEINFTMHDLLESLSQMITKGVIFIVDYGYGAEEYYHPERNRGTLGCFYRHRFSENPFENIGKQDITAHVNFTEVASKGVDLGWELLGFTTQAGFLLSLGLTELLLEAQKNLSFEEAFRLQQGIKLLMLPQEMGEIVKVMALGKGIKPGLLGFRFTDRRRDL